MRHRLPVKCSSVCTAAKKCRKVDDCCIGCGRNPSKERHRRCTGCGAHRRSACSGRRSRQCAPGAHLLLPLPSRPTRSHCDLVARFDNGPRSAWLTPSSPPTSRPLRRSMAMFVKIGRHRPQAQRAARDFAGQRLRRLATSRRAEPRFRNGTSPSEGYRLCQRHKLNGTAVETNKSTPVKAGDTSRSASGFGLCRGG